jgi:hypothetical protein
MADNKKRKIIYPKGGMLNDVALRIKLILRLMADPRVSIFLKALPIGTLVYLFFPDLVPGPIDDMAVIWLGAYLFVELCPPDVVKEHMDALRQVVPGQWHDAPSGEIRKTDDDVVDAEYWDQDQ